MIARNAFLSVLWSAAALAVPALAGAQAEDPIRVIEEQAIPMSRFLSKAEFDDRYPGKSVAGTAQLDSGWYVSYRHESLNYYFGPILLESIGEDYKAQLGEIVAEAVAERPDLQGYTIKLSFEPSETEPESTEGAGESSGAGSPGGPSSPPQPQGGFWSFVRKLFGL